MISEAPFFTAVATVSMTLAGFSGLLVALRRGDQLRPADVFHLRGIAETGLANALIALLTIALATLVGLHTATRALASIALMFVAFQIAVFTLRQRRASIRVGLPHAIIAVIIDLLGVGLAIATIAVGAVGYYEALLLLLLARPMWDFVRVLRDMASPTAPGK